MADNYARIVRGNLEKIFENPSGDLADRLGATAEGQGVELTAFGEACRIGPEGIVLGGREAWGVRGIIISLYALTASDEHCVIEPLKAYKDFPDSMPYVGAFATHTERTLVPHVERIKAARPCLTETLHIEDASAVAGGDVSFFVRPLPKIVLCYIFYRADEDFPASATCLFSSNACVFLPMDGLADVGEYTSKKILSLI